jgi:hypothetical protein
VIVAPEATAERWTEVRFRYADPAEISACVTGDLVSA